MPIAIKYLCKSTRLQRTRAARNLCGLLADLPPAQQLLLNRLATVFAFEANDRESGGADYRTRTIHLNLKEFNQFQYWKRRSSNANQRWALSTLKEEAIHFLDDHIAFTSQRVWKKAVRLELAMGNAERDILCAAQREHDSSDTWEKLSPEEYAADLTLLERACQFIAGRSESASELLADLLLARNYLRLQGHAERVIERMMRGAFPHTYSLALQFEASLLRCAARGLLANSELDKADQTPDVQTKLPELHAEWRRIAQTIE
ncbi:MAG: hypothetical protein ACJ8R9_05505 [Steroidobacteraceae bacterium]